MPYLVCPDPEVGTHWSIARCIKINNKYVNSDVFNLYIRDMRVNRFEAWQFRKIKWQKRI